MPEGAPKLKFEGYSEDLRWRVEKNDKLSLVLAKVTEVAVLPHVVFKVLELSASSDSGTADIERAINVDPGFSSKILVLANSAYMALPRRITSIREALLFLGFKQVRQLAMTVGVFDLFAGKNDRESLRRRAWWRHSVDSAISARWLADQTKKVSGDDAYTCALLHLIGKTLLDRYGGVDYKHVEDIMAQGLKDYKAEEAIYGCHHIQVATAVCMKWRLPESLVSGLNYAHAADPDDTSRFLRAVVALASRIATYAIEGADISDQPNALPLWALEVIGLGHVPGDQIIKGATAAIAAWNVQF
jgi:HD-like signal output (HDOD) protein